MVFNGVILVSAAKTSAEVWQNMACIGEHERIDGQQMVDLVICFPLQQLGRLLLYLWTFLCVPPVPHPYYYSNSSSSDDDDDFYYHQPAPDADDDEQSDH